MSRTEGILDSAHRRAGPAMGWLSLCITSRRGVTRAGVLLAIKRLRDAADRLEDLL